MLPDLGTYAVPVLSSYAVVRWGLLIAVVVASIWKARRVRARLEQWKPGGGRTTLRVNWLMLLPVALTMGFFGIAGYQLMNNAKPCSMASTPRPCAPPSRAGRHRTWRWSRWAETALPDPAPILEENGLVVVNFFASWCPPCRAEHPTLTALAEAGTPLYGVNYRDRVDQALGFLDELGNPYDRIGRDEQARNGADWGVVAMPETFFIDETGTVVLHFRGPVTERSLTAQIRPPWPRPATACRSSRGKRRWGGDRPYAQGAASSTVIWPNTFSRLPAQIGRCGQSRGSFGYSNLPPGQQKPIHHLARHLVAGHEDRPVILGHRHQPTVEHPVQRTRQARPLRTASLPCRSTGRMWAA